ncbi:hypothetical protein RJZ56_005753 [Blastomyces dermatitidis]|uniref:Uncharacterized protein n=3 Tax=Blastomyces TaxID=229219 RepID=A0A179UHW8_BLAGS|nr:uncharacterized protein BDBG_03626 [Blastomyces gilchristii SLH14081]XP_045272883.1 uncharacterized protein BDCG_08314 [Blastomyces dermatitidis ER-3]EGE85377.2 hypothetical protein BDDG_08322 [Blastomyces dermatitidis ATCC 18188]EQL32947.1 hypothetical protein BDFG_04930 [Blastomyces dermatitidis ATCC 26199]EEQ85045.2 hypothetical protein BDCG_08314 [Blastomyces dermatitidis ER-3]OAT07584.1 hypothetical protein BDBG_03626 [Blastomyces gilchristii SLH14081]
MERNLNYHTSKNTGKMTLHADAAAGALTSTTLACYLHKADINEQCKEKGKGTIGLTALALAAKNGHIEVVRLLLDHGAQVDAASSQNRTPLWIVTTQGHGPHRAEIVELLLRRGANARSSHPELDGGSKPLENELLNLKDPEVIQLLVEAKGTTARSEKLAAAASNSEIDDAMISTTKRRKLRAASVNLVTAFLIFVLTVIDNAAITRMVLKIFATTQKSDINPKPAEEQQSRFRSTGGNLGVVGLD